MKTQIAKLKYLKISPRKTRLVADLIKGLPTNEAEAQLLILPNRASGPILKLLRSAVANAKNNQKLNPDRLWVKDIRVDIGPRQKRWRTRARGSSSMIEKKSSHITLILEESEKEITPKFKFMPKPKKVKKTGKKIKKTEHEEKEKSPKQEKPKRFEALRRMFRRKSI
jgi:large subunit ribosomal protein L22